MEIKFVLLLTVAVVSNWLPSTEGRECHFHSYMKQCLNNSCEKVRTCNSHRNFCYSAYNVINGTSQALYKGCWHQNDTCETTCRFRQLRSLSLLFCCCTEDLCNDSSPPPSAILGTGRRGKKARKNHN